MYGVAAAAFVALFAFEVPFPVVVLAAGVAGAVLSRGGTGADEATAATEATTVIDAMAEAGELGHTRPSRRRALVVLVTCGLLWVTPMIALAVFAGRDSVFVDEGLFFSKTAMVTFGGAYAVLAYIAQRAVEDYGWLAPGEMLDGLGLAETTPGPLIMVVQFVGFLGAYRNPGGLDPVVAGIVGSAITVWVTFVPCFLWIFLGAPYVESIRRLRRLRDALSAITAAVVGVVVNLSVWFALHVVFGVVDERHVGPVRLLVPDMATLDVAALVLAAGSMIAMFRLHWGLARTLAASAALGAAWSLWLAR